MIRQREKGMITVEAVLSLIHFIIVILGIISFINLFMVHNKIQFAIQQMGNELSCYTYFYQAFGIRAADMELNSEMDKQTVKVDKALEDVESFFTAVDKLGTSVGNVNNSSLSNLQELADAYKEAGNAVKETGDTGKEAFQSVKELVKDPKGTLRGFIYLVMEMGEESGKSLLLNIIASGMAESYLDTGFAGGRALSADEYLKYFGVQNGVDGLDFGESTMFSKEAEGGLEFRMIDIVVEYDIDIYILKLFLKEPAVHVVQRCVVPAWLDGDGRTYHSE